MLSPEEVSEVSRMEMFVEELEHKNLALQDQVSGLQNQVVGLQQQFILLQLEMKMMKQKCLEVKPKPKGREARELREGRESTVTQPKNKPTNREALTTNKYTPVSTPRTTTPRPATPIQLPKMKNLEVVVNSARPNPTFWADASPTAVSAAQKHPLNKPWEVFITNTSTPSNTWDVASTIESNNQQNATHDPINNATNQFPVSNQFSSNQFLPSYHPQQHLQPQPQLQPHSPLTPLQLLPPQQQHFPQSVSSELLSNYFNQYASQQIQQQVPHQVPVLLQNSNEFLHNSSQHISPPQQQPHHISNQQIVAHQSTTNLLQYSTGYHAVNQQTINTQQQSQPQPQQQQLLPQHHQAQPQQQAVPSSPSPKYEAVTTPNHVATSPRAGGTAEWDAIMANAKPLNTPQSSPHKGAIWESSSNIFTSSDPLWEGTTAINGNTPQGGSASIPWDDVHNESSFLHWPGFSAAN